jgi:hypothetical protein
MKKGAPWLKTTLIQCACAATRVKGSYLQAQYLRLRSRLGAKEAIGAVAASMLTAAYHMLKDGTLYQDLGASHFYNRAKTKQVLRLESRLQNLGFILKTAVAHRHRWPASRFGASETCCFVIRARLQSGRKVLKEKRGFSPCKTSDWQKPWFGFFSILDSRFSTAQQITKLV